VRCEVVIGRVPRFGYVPGRTVADRAIGQTGPMHGPTPEHAGPDGEVSEGVAPAGVQLDGSVQREAFTLACRLVADPGEVVGLVGAMGSGKSTVLALLAGLLGLTDGRLEGPGGVWDEPATGAWVAPPARPLAYLGPRPVLLDDVPAVAQVAAALPSGDLDEAAALLDGLGLAASVRDRDGWTLSGGETQRVALARCIGARAPVLVLDDPFAALDTRTRQAVRAWLGDALAQRRAIVVLACSDPADTALLADRVVEPGGP